MSNFALVEICLNHLLDEIVFEGVALKQFILLVGVLIKYSNFRDQIISKYLAYIKEINDYITSVIILKENAKEKFEEEEEYFFVIKSYIYYFGFKGIEEQNLTKSIEYMDKGSNLTTKIYIKKHNEFFKYNIKKELKKRKLLTNDELIKAKKELIIFFSKNAYLKYQIIDCYLIGEDYFEGITRKKDELNALIIYKEGQKTFVELFLIV